MTYRVESAMVQFDRWSASYDRSILQRLFFSPSHQLLLDNLRPGDRDILDIGCGTGRFAEEVLRRRPWTTVWGLDLSTQMLRQGVARGQDDGFYAVRGDSERLPFRDDFFDAITCSHSFHHYPRQERVVAEMFRVLRPGGRLLIIDGDRDRPWGWLVFDLIVPMAEGAVHHCSAKRFRNLYRDAGFVNVRQEKRRGLLPFVLTIGQANKEYLTTKDAKATKRKSERNEHTRMTPCEVTSCKDNKQVGIMSLAPS